jgi:hypothetical protein
MRVEDSTLTLQAGRALSSKKDVLLLFSVRGWVNPRAIGKLKEFDDLIGNRTSDIPTSKYTRRYDVKPQEVRWSLHLERNGQN